MSQTSEAREGVRALLTMAAVGALLGVSGIAAQTPTAGNPQAQSGNAIHVDAARIRAHVKALTGAPLEAHGAEASGRDGAADYIAKQFASYGLRPAGENGSYFQNVPMTEVTTLAETSFTLVTPSLQTLTLRNLEDFVTHDEAQQSSAYIDAPIVFLGYGIQAPTYGWDDYRDTDLNGKVALLVAGQPSSDDPKFFAGQAPTYYGEPTYKFAEVARRGAVGALIIYPEKARGGWETARDTWGAPAYLPQDTTPKLRAASWIRFEAASKLATLAGLDLRRLSEQARSKEFRPAELPLRLQAHVASEVRSVVARNVLAALPSRGPASHEVVLYTAHADPHTVAEASACSVLIELARVWSLTPVTPRTIVFAALTAENHGLIGSQYLTMHSPVPPGKVSVDLSYDALAPSGDVQEVVVNGAERTTFYSTVQAQAKALGLTIHGDPRTEHASYYRSSPFSLARAGIPAFSIAEGEGRHRSTTAEPRADTDFSGVARLATLGYELGAQASAQPHLVAWLPGDEFETERKRSQRLDHITTKPRPHKPKPPKP